MAGAASFLDILQPFLPSRVTTPVADITERINWAVVNRIKFADYGKSIYCCDSGVTYSQAWEGSPWTAGQVAKAYLASQEWSWSSRRYHEIEITKPALYFNEPAVGEWSYLDLVSAYWQIGKLLPWWVGPVGSRKESLGVWKHTDELSRLRSPRLILFGLLTYPGGTTTWYEQDGTTKLATCPPRKAKYANQVWGNDILVIVNAFAQDLLASFAGVPLFHTDGAIVPFHLSRKIREWCMDRWKLEAAEKERGEGRILGPGNYEFRATYNAHRTANPISSCSSLDIEAVRSWWLRYASGT